MQRMECIGANIEIRRIVLAQIDAIGQYLAVARCANHQERGVSRRMIRIFLPLIGNRGDLALPIFKHVTGQRAGRSLRFGEFRQRSFGIILRSIRWRAVTKGMGLLREVAKLDRFKVNIPDGRRHGYIAGNLGHLACYFNRQALRCTGTCRDGKFLACRHRKLFV